MRASILFDLYPGYDASSCSKVVCIEKAIGNLLLVFAGGSFGLGIRREINSLYTPDCQQTCLAIIEVLLSMGWQLFHSQLALMHSAIIL